MTKPAAKGRSEQGISAQLPVLLRLAGADSRGWLTIAILGSVLLALLDAAGVAAMLPLMEIVTGADPGSGTIGVVSRAVGTEDITVLLPVVAGFVALAFIVKSALAIAFRWWLLGRTTRIAADAGSELLRRYVDEPFVVHRTRNMPELYRNVNDATVQAASVLQSAISLGSDLVMVLFILIILAIASPLATVLAVVLFGGIVGGLQLVLRRRQQRLGEESAESRAEVWRHLLPALNGFREIRIAGVGSTFVGGYHEARLQSARSTRSLSMVAELPKYILEIGYVVVVVCVAGILFATGDPATAIGVLGIFAAASLRALPTLHHISACLAGIRGGQAGLRIVAEAVADTEAAGRRDDIARTAPFQGDIEFADVRFRFPDAQEDVLKGISVVVGSKSTVAVVGASGAGKSTMLDLLLGLLEPTSGTISCGGRPITADLAGWFAGLGVVPQDVYLLNDTLAANIAFGRREVDRDRMREVIHLAQLEPVVADLPDGLDTRIGERGIRLSGGQRQRIGLARALYRDPEVLVLDEATAALDNETESEIAKILGDLRGHMTVIIVAHRLSTVRDVDQLVFMADGRVAGTGSFTEVRESVPAFAKLVELGELR